MANYFLTTLLFLIGAHFGKSDESTIAFNRLPISSFIESYISDSEEFQQANSKKFVFYLDHRINKPTDCSFVEFTNVPEDLKQYITGGLVFRKLKKDFNQRPAWYNGKWYLSYAPVGSHGTWIVGNSPGNDSGFIYIRPTFISFSPLGIESSTSWHWSVNNVWQEMNNLKLNCQNNKVLNTTDNTENTNVNILTTNNQRNDISSFFYEIETFYELNTIYSSQLMSVEQSSTMYLLPTKHKSKIKIIFSNKSMKNLEHSTKEFYIHSIKVIASKGAPVMLTSSSQPLVATMARCITYELYPDKSWRIIFQSIQALNPGSQSISVQDEASDNNKDILLVLSSVTGTFLDPWKVQSLDKKELNQYSSYIIQSIQQTNIGDYLWIWSSQSKKFQEITIRDNSSEIRKEQIMEPSERIRTEDMVLLCLSKHISLQLSTTWMFRYYPSDRRDQMNQTPLERDTQLITITIEHNYNITTVKSSSQMTTDSTIAQVIECDMNNNGENNSPCLFGNKVNSVEDDDDDGTIPHIFMTMSSTKNNQNQYYYTQLDLKGLLHIGKNPISFLRNFIKSNEGLLGPDVSSCYYYHAAVSLPQPFVYAAELLCVLEGGKSLTMIQYTSDGDPSYKFPLMAELTNGLVSLLTHQKIKQWRHMKNSTVDNEKNIDSVYIDVSYTIQKYRQMETIIFYRPSQIYILDNILPRGGTAQALHPMPFPREDHLHEDHTEQIYNAAWNGLLLGYPKRFVESYCTNFHNDLQYHEKRAQFSKAKSDLKMFLKTTYNKNIPIIKLGSEQPISNETWKLLDDIFIHRSDNSLLF